MNSCLYKSQVMHRRTSPKRHAFKYGLFMFLLDLDELDEIGKGFNLIGLNRFAPFEFRDADHYDPNEIGLKNSIQQYVAENGISRPIGRIQLLTHLRTWGHLFNPVSFYFVSDNKGQPLCSIAEVGNTFNEQKLFLIPSDEKGKSVQQRLKNFYVSPYSELDTQFHFRIHSPGDRLRIAIDQSQNGDLYFRSAVTGEKRLLSDRALLSSAMRFPFLTLKIVGAIHWQAMLLYLKGAPFQRKADNPEKQTETHPYLIKKPHQQH